jgi:hypothetical protein
MSHIKKFSYQDVSKRWLIMLALFITFSINSFILTDIIIILKQYLPYYPVIKIVMIICMVSLFAGNISGRLIFPVIKNHRIITVASALLFTVFTLLFFGGKLLNQEIFSVINIFIMNNYYIIPLIAIPSFITGLLNTYYLKISCGDFIDEKNFLPFYIILLPAALGSGFFAAYMLNFLFGTLFFTYILIILISIPLSVILLFIKAPYSPEQLYSQNFYEDESLAESPVVQRDDLFFTYINFSYILVYMVLGFVLFIKFFGNTYYNALLYITVTLFALPAGILLGRRKKPSFWHVYSEMLYPVFFLLYLSLLYLFNSKTGLYAGLVFSAIPVLIFGFSLEQTVKNITGKYEHEKRFSILNFSMFILPYPILISITTITFSYSLFFIILYSAALLNIIIPGIFLFNMKINPLNKILYLVFALVFLPCIMFIHLYFKIPLTNSYFAPSIENYELIRDTDFTAPYITGKGEVLMFNSPVFFLSDNYIRNYKRAAASTSLFSPREGKTLILDSNQKFFRNPVYSYYTESVYIDTLTEKAVDYKRLPFSGRQPYVPESEYLFKYLTGVDRFFDLVIDAPNILDQNFHSSRFSENYYLIIKNILNRDGIYASIYDLQYMNNEMLSYAALNLKENFSSHIIFLFSNILLIISSDNPDSLKITPDSMDRISQFSVISFIRIFILSTIFYLPILRTLISFFPEKLI